MRTLLIGEFKKLAFIISVIVLSAVIFPSQFVEVDARRGPNQALRVALHSDSPAMVAIEEVQYLEMLNEGSEPALDTVSFGVVTLNSGEGSEQLIDSLRQEEKTNRPNFFQEFQTAPSLQGIRISSQATDLSADPSSLAATEKLNTTQILKTAGLANVQGKSQGRQSLYLSEASQKAQPSSFQQKAQELVKNELEQRKNKKQVGPVTVMAPGAESSEELPQALKGARIASSASSGASGKPKDSKAAARDPWGQVSEDKLQVTLPYLISGKIQVSRPLRPSEQIQVFHVKGGMVRSTGKVWARDLSYEISVNSGSGYILAEVSDEQGQVTFEARRSLETFDLKNIMNLKISSIDLALKQPAKNQLQVQVESGYSFAENSIGVPGAEVSLLPYITSLEKVEESLFIEREIQQGSTAIVEATATDHWPTQAMVVSGVRTTVRVFHKNLIKAFLNLIGLKQYEESEQPALVWGVVKKDGVPVKGAEVEIESYQNGFLSYFEYNLPNRRASNTDKSGQFVWASRLPGRVSIRVTYKGQRYPAQVVSTVSGTVSWIEVNFGSMQNKVIKAQPLFENEKAFSGSVRILGSDKILDEVVDEVKLKMLDGNGLYLTEMDAGYDYMMTRAEVPMSAEEVHHLAVPTGWFTQLKASLKASDRAETGAILGVLPESGAEVYVHSHMGYELKNPIYFDEQGKRTMLKSEAVGFIFFNVDPDLYTVTILPNESEEAILNTLNVDTGFVSLSL